MGIKDWFRQRLSESREALDTQLPPTSIRKGGGPAQEDREDSGEAAGLDFRTAIEAHQRWKSRLLERLEGRSDEKLDWRVVCRDDQCPLGQWLHGAGAAKLGEQPLFQALRGTHADFHHAAGEIVQLADGGETGRATEELQRGRYARLSLKVQGQLAQLYLQATGG